MGKKAPDSGKKAPDSGKRDVPESSGKRAPDSGKKAETKTGEKKTKAEEEPSTSALSRLLQQRQRRPIFFVVHFVVCAWLLLVSGYSACDVKASKREDCGFSGISTAECVSIACFIKDGAKLEKTIKFDPSGLSVAESTGSNELTVTAVTGAAAEYNSQTTSAEDRVLVGDVITKVGKDTKLKTMKKALSETGKAHSVKIQRSKLPSYLRWITLGGKYTSYVESALVSRWSRSFNYLGGCGFVCWALSGYPPTSLPVYYFGLSGLTAFAVHRCCYDDHVDGGVPHCYKGKSLDFEVAVAEAWTTTRKTVTKVYKDIAKDPKKYFKSFIPKF